MSESTQNNSPHSGMLKTIAAAFITIFIFLGLALVWFKESPTTLLKPISSKSSKATLPSLSYNDNRSTASSTIETHLTSNTKDISTTTPVPTQQSSPKITEQPLQILENNATSGLDSFFVHLNSTSHYQENFPDSNSKDHFSALLQKLIDNPPVVSGEADDLFTLLQNTAHFFRVLGGKNISLTKTIISENKANIEQVAADFYLVLNNQDLLLRHYNVTTTPQSFYSYGCFFLNTMGGRLYMFRRDLEMRMLLSYYSLLFVYYAEIDGENYNGIDVRPFLKTLIYEMENYGQNLKRRDIYLARLYNLENSLN